MATDPVRSNAPCGPFPLQEAVSLVILESLKEATPERGPVPFWFFHEKPEGVSESGSGSGKLERRAHIIYLGRLKGPTLEGRESVRLVAVTSGHHKHSCSSFSLPSIVSARFRPPSHTLIPAVRLSSLVLSLWSSSILMMVTMLMLLLLLSLGQIGIVCSLAPSRVVEAQVGLGN